MITTELCPFEEQEYLTDIADTVASTMDNARTAILHQLSENLPPDKRTLLQQLDNLHLDEINAVQAATTEAAVCSQCPNNGQACRKPTEQ